MPRLSLLQQLCPCRAACCSGVAATTAAVEGASGGPAIPPDGCILPLHSCWLNGWVARGKCKAAQRPPLGRGTYVIVLLPPHGPADVTSGINTRRKLQARDPALAALMLRVYGDGSWRYSATAPQRWPQWRKEQQQWHAAKAASAAGSMAAEPLLQPSAGKRKRAARRAAGSGMLRLLVGPRHIVRSLARLASSCLPRTCGCTTV